MSRLILWRHGLTTWNGAGRIQGHTDIPLSEEGLVASRAAARRLAEVARPDVIVSSDLRRAADSAAELAALVGLEVGLDPRLRERTYGEWEGLTQAEIADLDPLDFARWQKGEPLVRGDVESADDLGKRLGAAIDEAVARADGGLAVVVTHGGAARVALGPLLGWPPSVIRSVAVLRNSYWSELRLTANRGWTLHAHNLGA